MRLEGEREMEKKQERSRVRGERERERKRVRIPGKYSLHTVPAQLRTCVMPFSYTGNGRTINVHLSHTRQWHTLGGFQGRVR